jgi:hypothetical protein
VIKKNKKTEKTMLNFILWNTQNKNPLKRPLLSFSLAQILAVYATTTAEPSGTSSFPSANRGIFLIFP